MPGRDCWIQNYVDTDPGPGARDYTCGTRTYDRQDGVNFRLADRPAMEQGVAVLAAADGIVSATRDGMDDVGRTGIDADALRGRECGNGVLVNHGEGWQTQYCHLRKDSVRVTRGQRVSAGTPLGNVGYSGNIEFYGLTFRISRDGKAIDPMTGLADAACGTTGQSLFTPTALAALPYEPTAVVNQGFSADLPTRARVWEGDYPNLVLPRDAPALIFWTEIIGTQKGDRERVRFLYPDGTVAGESNAVLETLASRFVFVGRDRQAGEWPAGFYRGEYVLERERGGQWLPVLRKDLTLTVR